MALIPSARYPSQTEAAAGYPHGKARNSGSYQDGTGTPLEKDWINDIWGFLQALLGRGDVTPNGVPDADLASQYLEALINVAVNEPKADQTFAMMQLRQIGIDTPFTDTAASLVVKRMSNGPLLFMKAGANGVHRASDGDDGHDVLSSLASITSLVTGVAGTGATRLVAIGTGGNRCCFSTDFGVTWTAGSDLGATPERIIHNQVHNRYMATFAAGVNVAQDVDGASVWTNAATTLTSAQGGIACFNTGETIACGLDGAADVAMSRSTDGGATWAATATVPNPADYIDSGNIDNRGNDGSVYHVGRVSGTSVRICRTFAAMSWTLLATLPTFITMTVKPRIIVCPDTGLMTVLAGGTSGVAAWLSRDSGTTWIGPVFYRPRALNAFAMARGRLFATFNGAVFSTDYLL